MAEQRLVDRHQLAVLEKALGIILPGGKHILRWTGGNPRLRAVPGDQRGAGAVHAQDGKLRHELPGSASGSANDAAIHQPAAQTARPWLCHR
jgi:hypothetical protein